MEEIVAAASIGTARQSPPVVKTLSDLDHLLARLPADSERRLLLTAGLLAVYAQAGRVPDSAPPLASAPMETLEATSKEVADTLAAMARKGTPQFELSAIVGMDAPRSPSGLGAEHDDLLPEAFELIRRRGLRLPHMLLPTLLEARTESLRTALLPIIGERGCWLARFNANWGWVLAMGTDGEMAADSDAVWEVGSVEERHSVLQRHRALSPDGARERLDSVFASEPADVRARLIGALKVGLSARDEAFLERVLDDRSAAVRSCAVELLADIPSSAFATRVCQRAHHMFSRSRMGKLTVNAPAEFDSAWQRDGLERSRGFPGLDVPGAWLLQTVSLVPVRHWTERFGISMEKLVGSLKGERELEVLEAWTAAAIRHGEVAAMPALWDGWKKRWHRPQRHPTLLASLLSDLAAAMHPSDAEPRLVQMFDDPPLAPVVASGRVVEAAGSWSETLDRQYLDVLRRTIGSLARRNAPLAPWLHVLVPGARRIGPRAIVDALALLPPPVVEERRLRKWNLVLESLGEKLALRQRLLQELSR